MTAPHRVVLDTSATPFHDAVARALRFPDHYGRNLDALADCLRDVDPDVVVAWAGWRVVEADHPRTFDVALRLLRERLTVDLVDEPRPVSR